MEENIIGTCIDLAQPVFEKAVILAAEYTKKCNREILTSQDMEYALKYCVMNVVGEDVGSIIPEAYDSDDSDEEEGSVARDLSLRDKDQEPEVFTRYSGDDPKMNAVNQAYDTWDQWEPTNPLEKMMYDSVKKLSQ